MGKKAGDHARLKAEIESLKEQYVSHLLDTVIIIIILFSHLKLIFVTYVNALSLTPPRHICMCITIKVFYCNNNF